MKDVFLVYDRCCFYEIVILSDFLNSAPCNLVFCSPDGKPVRAMEGFSVHVDASLEDLDKAQIRSFIVPGGAVSGIDTAEVKVLLRDLKQRGALIAGICAGVDVLDHAGILHDVKSDDDWVCAKQVATARANAYVDFALAVAKKPGLFASETDLQETIRFWKYYQRVQ